MIRLGPYLGKHCAMGQRVHARVCIEVSDGPVMPCNIGVGKDAGIDKGTTKGFRTCSQEACEVEALGLVEALTPKIAGCIEVLSHGRSLAGSIWINIVLLRTPRGSIFATGGITLDDLDDCLSPYIGC